jgi:hypothetical protein
MASLPISRENVLAVLKKSNRWLSERAIMSWLGHGAPDDLDLRVLRGCLKGMTDAHVITTRMNVNVRVYATHEVAERADG